MFEKQNHQRQKRSEVALIKSSNAIYWAGNFDKIFKTKLRSMERKSYYKEIVKADGNNY